MTRADRPIRLPGKLYDRLTAFCDRTGRAKTKVNALALTHHLDAEEAKEAGRKYPRYEFQELTQTTNQTRKK